MCSYHLLVHFVPGDKYLAGILTTLTTQTPSTTQDTVSDKCAYARPAHLHRGTGNRVAA